MNHIYRLVWNPTQQALVAVSESATGRGKSSTGSALVGALLGSVLLAGASAAIAATPPPNTLPTGAQVTAGAATVSTAANTLTVNQSTQRAAINWQSFSVGANGTVNFVQPNAASVTLNRVVGNEQSVIAGALNANGQVFLLNSNGVLFTGSAQVNVGGIVASTLNMSDADFMAGRSTFASTSGTGSVINFGTINAADGGYVALLGNQVSNRGVITARLGTAALAAGDRISLNFNGNSMVGVTIDQGTLNALVENKQAIRADGGLVTLTAKGLDTVLGSLVNNTGEIRAQTIANKEGKIYLLGDMGSGTANVGGTLDASAPNSGNGGFIETSAARVRFSDNVNITTKAASGQNGQWLIDPLDFTIAASGGDITGAQLGTLLESNNVTIQTVAGMDSLTNRYAVTAGSGNINVQDSITKAVGADSTLTLKADHDIVIDPDVSISSTSNKLNVHLSANNDTAGSATITISPGATIATNGGNFIAGGALVNNLPSNDGAVDITIGGGADTQITSINAGAGDIKLYANTFGIVSYTTLAAANVIANTQATTVSSVDGVKIQASNSMTLSAVQDIVISGAYQPPAGSSYLTTLSETSLSAGNSMSLDAEGGISLYGLSVKLTNPSGANVLNLRSGSSIRLSETSFGFRGTPDLTILLNQNSLQASVNSIDSNYTDLASYLTGTSTSLYQFALNHGLSTAGTHFGLKGGGYRLGVYSDFTPQQISPKSLDNGLLASGDGLTDSVGLGGNLKQPFYYDASFDRWFKLTFSDISLDIAFGYSGTSTPGWNNSGTIITSDRGGMDSSISGLTLDTSGLSNGVGVVKASYDLDLGGTGTIRMSNEYSLGSGQSFIKTITQTTNSGSSQVDNGRLWVGARDDYVVITDSNVKTKGNLTNNGFVPITTQNEQARSVIISEFDPSTSGTPGGAILFHSTNMDADTVTASCCRFRNIYNKDPRTSDIVTANDDGSYGIFMNYGNMAVGATRTVTWYYGASSLSNIGNVANQVATLGGGLQIQAPTEPPYGAPTPTPTPTLNLEMAISNAVNTPTNFLPPVFTNGLPPQSGSATSPTPNVVNSPAFVSASFGGSSSLLLISSPQAGASTQGVTLSQARTMLGLTAAGDIPPDVRVPVSRNSMAEIVNGGVRLPDGVEQQLFVVEAN